MDGNADGDESQARGALLARFRPWNLGVNLGTMPITAGFPLARFEVYEHGLLVRALNRDTFIERGDIMLIVRVALGIRVHWQLGDREAIAFASAVRPGRIAAALRDAGFAVA